MKQWVYLTAALAMWVTALSIFAITNSQYMSQRVDRVHTYQRTKFLSNYQSTKGNIQNLFVTNQAAFGTPYWDDQTGPGCVGLNNFTTAANPTCYSKRTQLVTTIKQQMGCDVNKAPVCNCLTVLLRAVAQDNSTNSSQGAFTGIGKNLTGYGGYMAFALDECKWLFRNVHTAVESNMQIVRRTAILFYLTTLTTFNLLDHIWVPWLAARLGCKTEWSQSGVRTLVILLTLAAGLGGHLGVEGQAFSIPCFISLAPLAILFWYEWYLPKLPHKPWLHPYYFTASYGCIVVLALVENGVVDYDIIAAELFKVQLAGFLYLVVVWFYMFPVESGGSLKPGFRDIFESKPLQDSILIGTTAAVALSVISATAPYTVSPAINYLWVLPGVFTLYAFGGITWAHSLKLSEFYGDLASDKVRRRKEELEASPAYFSPSKAFFCAAHLAIQLLLMLYYCNDYTEVNLTVISPAIFNTIQLNTNASWLLPS